MAKWRVELDDKADPEYIEADEISQDKNTGDYVFVVKDTGAGMVGRKVAIYSKGRVKSVRRED